MEHIADMENYIRSRQRKGKKPSEVRKDLEKVGYDFYAAEGLVMLHWKYEEGDNGTKRTSTGGS